MNLDALLDAVSVMPPGCWENENTPLLGEWWAVCTDDDGIIAYFLKEVDAFRFRLSYINAILSPADIANPPTV